MKKFCLLVLASFATLVAQDFTILTINDVYALRPMEGRGGLAEFKTLLDAERAKCGHHIVTLNGDFLSPSILGYYTEGAHMVDLFNAIGIEMVCFGNHEFDFGDVALRERIDQAEFVWLGTNVLEEGEPFAGTQGIWIQEAGGLRIGYFGICTCASAYCSNASPAIEFVPAIEAAKGAIARLDAFDVDVIIALTHLHIEEDLELAQACPEIDVILGGHDHHPFTFHNGRTLIHKSGMDAQFLGRIDLSVEDGLVHSHWTMIPNEGFEKDREIASMITHCDHLLDEYLDEELAIATSPLDGPMGNLIADILCEELDTDCAIVSAGLIRNEFDVPYGGGLTRRDIVDALPFYQKAIAIELSGSEILQVLEHGLSAIERNAPRFPHVSQMQVVYNSGAPVGERVCAVQIRGETIDLERTYTVATTKYMWYGGNGYASLKGKPVVVPAGFNEMIVPRVMDYLLRKKRVGKPADGRLEGMDEGTSSTAPTLHATGG